MNLDPAAAAPPGRRYRFEGVEVDPGARRLRVDGRDVECSQRVLRLALLLVAAPWRILGRDEVIARLWPGVESVADEALTQLVFRLRALLGAHARHVVVVRGVGIRLDADVHWQDEHVPAANEPYPAAPAPRSEPAAATAATPAPGSAPPRRRARDRAPPTAQVPRGRRAEDRVEPAASPLPLPVPPLRRAGDAGAPPGWLQRHGAAAGIALLTLALIALVAWIDFRGRLQSTAAQDVVDPQFALSAADLYATRPETVDLVRRAFAAEAGGDQPRAQTLFEAAHASDARTPVPALMLALWATGAGGSDERVRAHLAPAQARVAASGDPYLELMLGYVRAEHDGDWNAAMRYTGSMLDLRPQAWFLRLARSHLLIARGMREAALEELRAIEVARLDHRKLEMALADRAAMGDVAGARAVLERVGDTAPEASRWFLSGRIDYSAGDYAAARSAFARAVHGGLRTNRLDVVARAQLYGGLLAAEAGDDAEARARLRDAQLRFRERERLQEAFDIGFLLAELEARNGQAQAMEGELAALREALTARPNIAAEADLRLIELRLTGRRPAAPLVVPAERAAELRGAQALIEARSAWESGDAAGARRGLELAREAGVFETMRADEARLLAAELGVEAPPPIRIDPPYPPLARFAARWALAAHEAGSRDPR